MSTTSRSGQEPARRVLPGQPWLIPSLTIVSALVAVIELVIAASSANVGALVSGLVFLPLTGLGSWMWRQQRLDAHARDIIE
ncbi:hypothetical protein [Arthrobacter sp. MA-N2]|uniref:hypothetical protein n=1 Tax=Arthrobacter sp. MA-N2 TaxID=1101188 RepID=UPI000487A45E|nr:hypothetical protein [Arthrobacter sp. MA-N2]